MCGHQEELFLPKPSEEVLGNVLEAMPMVSQLLVWRASLTSTEKEHSGSVTECIAAAHTNTSLQGKRERDYMSTNNANNNIVIVIVIVVTVATRKRERYYSNK